ncbi:BbrUII/HgiDII family restriction enzyme [Cellulomonas persica]|nr:ATP-binding protein [Cellulomonas persica]
MTMSLSVLKHLGLNLYSNLPAVLSEAVANAWDADATRVEITVDADRDRVVVQDNGLGMSRTQANERYLNVGYGRREDAENQHGQMTARGRQVMGRKGIGKLSLFSIAKTIEVQSRPTLDPDDPAAAPGEPVGFVMDLEDIQRQIAHDGSVYRPTPVPTDEIDVQVGTRLTLTNPSKDLRRAGAHIKSRLARRFSMLTDDFTIVVNGASIDPSDRDLMKKCRYVWVFGTGPLADALTAARTRNGDHVDARSGQTPGGRQIVGWIGAAKTSSDLRAPDADGESGNRVAILVRGKLAREDVLDAVGHSGLFTKFLAGELHADFLDDDAQEDIATSSRQGVREDDERFVDVRSFVEQELKKVGTDWNALREADGLNDAAKEVPAITDWIDGLKGHDTKASARRFVARVSSMALEPQHRRDLLAGAVVTFERLHRRDRLSEIEEKDPANLPALLEAFRSIDDVEAAMYYDIVQQRLDIIEKFEGLTDDDVIEATLRDYLFEHLWLLDPGWDRATAPVMEKSVKKIIQKSGGSKDRVDIKYRQTGSAHVIVELKRAGRRVSTAELAGQIRKYYGPVTDHVRGAEGQQTEVQVVCVLGKDPVDWQDYDGRSISREMLRPYNARIVTYAELITRARQNYSDFLKAHKKLGRVRSTIASIESQITERPDPDGT